MSTPLPNTQGRSPDVAQGTPAPSHSSKPSRQLACVHCQRRKVKCDRKYPCANCIKARVNCVQATQVLHRRRRRFSERKLLDCLRKYEQLLRQHGIKFEPLHADCGLTGEKESPIGEGGDSEDERFRALDPGYSTPSTPADLERLHEAKNVWRRALSQEIREPRNNIDSSDEDDDDDAREVVVKTAWDQLHGNDDHLLFGPPKTAVNIQNLHPEPVQIFRLWHLYLENIDPLLKVTHTPSLQACIIEAASNILNITPNLEALMFSIYCITISSLSADECLTKFGSTQEELLARYQFGCQQALWNCGFLRCGDRDCLTALYLYLVSLWSNTAPQSLSSVLGVAIRIAQRMGIHSEAALAKCNVLEAEMRRRLWWSLILFDTRIGELSSSKTLATMLNTTWDCKIPLNVNDSHFRLDMKEPPQVQGMSSEALFAVVRSEVGDFVRHTTFNLGVPSPATQQSSLPRPSELLSLEKTIEDKYLKSCDPENPLRYMTIWTTRGYIAKCRLIEHHFRYSGSALLQAGVHHDEAQEDAAMSYALSMLKCDTKLMISPLIKRFLWLVKSYFPFTAYIQVVQHLKWQPFSDQAERAWEIMSDNYQARFEFLHAEAHVFRIFTNIVLQASDVREAAFNQRGESPVIPRIVLSIRHRLAQMTPNAQSLHTGMPLGAGAESLTDLSMPMPMGFGSQSLLYSMGEQVSSGLTEGGLYANMQGMASLDIGLDQLDWPEMDWDLLNAQRGDADESMRPPHTY